MSLSKNLAIMFIVLLSCAYVVYGSEVLGKIVSLSAPAPISQEDGRPLGFYILLGAGLGALAFLLIPAWRHRNG